MKTINTKTPLQNFSGNSIKNEQKEDWTVGMVISTVLGGKVSNPTLGWILGKKFSTEDTVDLKAEEIVFINKELDAHGKNPQGGFGAIIIGQVMEILDGKEEVKEKK